MTVDVTYICDDYNVVAGHNAQLGVTIDDAEIGAQRSYLQTVDGQPVSMNPILIGGPSAQLANWAYQRTKGNFHFPANNTYGLIAISFNRSGDTPINLVMCGMIIHGDPTNYSDEGFIQDGVTAEINYLDEYNIPQVTIKSLDELCRSGAFYAAVEPKTSQWMFLDTNIPIFDTVAHANAYIYSGGQVSEGLLNGDGVVPEYDGYTYFIKNTIYKDGSLLHYYDFKLESNSPIDTHKLYLMESDDTIGYDLVLHGADNSHITKILSRNRNDAANDYAETSSIPSDYLRHSQKTASGSKYKPSYFRTNIYIFNNQAAADDYEQYGDTSGAVNVEEVNRANDTIVDGHIGDVVSQTDNGTSGISFAYGGQIYALSSVNLATFFTNVLFSTDTSVKDAILEGTQLFGTNQINAINGCMYLPISDISDIASVSSVNKCFIGTYEAPITANRVVANDKMINCGSAPFNETYGDYRDYEPYCKLGVLLPYIGYRELSISRYINKTVSLKYAVDVTTGACTAYLYSNNVIMDSFDGTMGVQRPLTAVNQQAQVSAVINGILGTTTQAAKTVGTAGTAAIGAAALSGASGASQALNMGGQLAGSGIGGGVPGTILSGYNTLQAALDPPMSTRGAYSGVLGQFANQYPYFIFSWLKTSKPANEIETVGLPSNAGGTVGSFGGYLKCSAFNLANGFGGTQSEANEIIAQMMEGVYIS